MPYRYRAQQAWQINLTCLGVLMVIALTSGPAFGNNYSLYSRSDLQTQQPLLDGVLDEAVWQQATVIELNYENEPGQGITAPVKTIAYLYEDGTRLHIAITALDPDPSSIRASLRERDNLRLDDNVGIIVDTFNDQRTGFGFFVNPLGAQADFSKQELDDEDASEDYAWDAIWNSAGQISDKGYVVEMSIPFHALRFPAGGGELIWNIAIQRTLPREHIIELANYRDDKQRKCSLCQYERLVGFKDIKTSNNIQITPTLTLGRTDTKDIANNGGWQSGEFENDMGVDLRWGISQNLVLNATLNPDFSQVEADAVQLDINNNYALFYEEKRPFFLDGADYLTTPLFDFVHTRNIADPDYGIKLTGKTGLHRYGVMVANDNKTTFLIPGNQGSSLAEIDSNSTAIIARYRADMGEQNNLGILITSRTDGGSDSNENEHSTESLINSSTNNRYHNHLLAVDGVLWINPSSSVNYQLAHSDTLNPLQIQTDFGLDEKQQGQAYLLSVNHQTNTLYLAASAERVDDDFRADLGFQERSNFQEFSLTGQRTWFADGHRWLNNYSLYADWDKSWDLNNTLLEEEVELLGSVNGAKQTTLEVGAIYRDSLYAGVYYREQQATFWGEFTPIKGFELSTFIQWGDQIDFINGQLGEQFEIATAINWQFNRHLQIEAEYDYSFLDVDGGELYNAGVLDTKFIWQFDARNQLRLIVQHTNIERDVTLYNRPENFDRHQQYLTTQLLYSYKINPQTLFFLGYSDSGLESDDVEQLTRTDRTLFAKFSYAWQH